jgi:hypothetical protein
MPIHRRLHRPSMCSLLAQISRTWSKLSYPRFCIQAENIMNPEREDVLDKNFSITESVAGYLSPKPIDRGIRLHQDLRLIEDQLRRPHPRARDYCDRLRRVWNEDIIHHTAQIYRIPVEFSEPKYSMPRGNRSHRRTQDDDARVRVIYNFLRTLRGKRDVAQVGRHLDSGIAGLEATNTRIQEAANTHAVDRAIKQILEENQRIQYG